MVIMTPEAKLIPASFRHQIQARIAVMATMIVTAVKKRTRGPTLTPTGEEDNSFAFPVAVCVAFISNLERSSKDFCSRLPERGVYLATGLMGIRLPKRTPMRPPTRAIQ